MSPEVLTRVHRSTVRPSIRSARDSRPPYVELPSPPILPIVLLQPVLDLGDPHQDDVEPGIGGRRSRPRGVVVPRPGLPDASAWGRSLALAMMEVLLAQRPPGQLSRWVDDVVLAELSYRQRRVIKGGRCSPASAKVLSVRVQHPHPEAAELSATMTVGPRVLALAFRLETLGDRWLCTALEVAPTGSARRSSRSLRQG